MSNNTPQPLINLVFLIRTYQVAIFLVRVQDGLPTLTRAYPRQEFSDLFLRMPPNTSPTLTKPEVQLVDIIKVLKFGSLSFQVDRGQPTCYLLDTYQNYKMDGLTEVNQ